MYSTTLNTLLLVILSQWNMLLIRTCSVLKLTTPEELVAKAIIIVRANASAYSKPPTDSNLWDTRVPDSVIRFDVAEIVKSRQQIPKSLFIHGYLSDHNDYNDGSVPYRFIRSNGRYGSCVANTYKQYAEFLLFLNDQYSPYWDALTPVNEQLHPPASNDPWLHWVKKQVSTSGASRLSLFHF